MASWRERCAWYAEFRSLGVRQVTERERLSTYHEEKLQEARRWLWWQEHLPKFVVAASAAVAVIAAALIGAYLK
jgi:hypothetical protein